MGKSSPNWSSLNIGSPPAPICGTHERRSATSSGRRPSAWNDSWHHLLPGQSQYRSLTWLKPVPLRALPNSLGLTKTFGTESIEEMDRISLLHLNLGLRSGKFIPFLENRKWISPQHKRIVLVGQSLSKRRTWESNGTNARNGNGDPKGRIDQHLCLGEGVDVWSPTKHVVKLSDEQHKSNWNKLFFRILFGREPMELETNSHIPQQLSPFRGGVFQHSPWESRDCHILWQSIVKHQPISRSSIYSTTPWCFPPKCKGIYSCDPNIFLKKILGRPATFFKNYTIGIRMI